MEYNRPEFKIPIVEYVLFANYGTKKLSLTRCSKTKVNFYIHRTIDNFQDYKYNPNNIYYYDKCDSYSSEDNIDLTIQDRRFEFNRNNMSLCENSCIFKSYAKGYIKCIVDDNEFNLRAEKNKIKENSKFLKNINGYTYNTGFIIDLDDLMFAKKADSEELINTVTDSSGNAVNIKKAE